jgi:hypothetical protein
LVRCAFAPTSILFFRFGCPSSGPKPSARRLYGSSGGATPEVQRRVDVGSGFIPAAGGSSGCSDSLADSTSNLRKLTVDWGSIAPMRLGWTRPPSGMRKQRAQQRSGSCRQPMARWGNVAIVPPNCCARGRVGRHRCRRSVPRLMRCRRQRSVWCDSFRVPNIAALERMRAIGCAGSNRPSPWRSTASGCAAVPRGSRPAFICWRHSAGTCTGLSASCR